MIVVNVDTSMVADAIAQFGEYHAPLLPGLSETHVWCGYKCEYGSLFVQASERTGSCARCADARLTHRYSCEGAPELCASTVFDLLCR